MSQNGAGMFRTYGIVWLLIVLALLPRVAAWSRYADNLSADPDLYRAIAENVAQGQGFSAPDTLAPTAFRPPTYPLLLAMIFALGGGNGTMALLQIACGCATVLAVWQIGRRLGLEQWAVIAALLVALDPLLIYYTTFCMTEVVATTLGTACLWWLAVRPRTAANDLVCGLLCGACVLCRPTFFPWVGLLLVVWCWQAWRATRPVGQELWHVPGRSMVWIICGLALPLSLWLGRNMLVMQQPILTTTHGGYTLLLGHNPAFYRDVLGKPWGTAWEDPAPHEWRQQLEQQMATATPPVRDEVARDRWMYALARQHIVDQPGLALQASLMQLGRLWDVRPHHASSRTISATVSTAMLLFYSLITLGGVSGLVSIIREKSWSRWWPLISLMAVFSAVHFVYWADMRMRAPLVPSLALLAASGCRDLFRYVRSVRAATARKL